VAGPSPTKSLQPAYRRGLTGAWALAAACLLVSVAHSALRVGTDGLVWHMTFAGVFVLAGALCVLRAALLPKERIAWLAIGTGVCLHGAGWLVGVAIGAFVAGAGLAGAIRAWELRVRTPKGSGLWLRVESFRRFLAASEAYHVEQAAARGVLREYTAWAVAVGEVDHWRHAMEAATNVPQADIGSALALAYIVPSLAAGTASASTAPSSSGGGGGFSGGVGGGGGGGGGGSW